MSSDELEVSGGSCRLIFMFGPIKAGPCPRNTPEPTFLPGFGEKLKAVGHQTRVGGHAPHLHSYAAQGRRGWSMPTIIIIIIVIIMVAGVDWLSANITESLSLFKEHAFANFYDMAFTIA